MSRQPFHVSGRLEGDQPFSTRVNAENAWHAMRIARLRYAPTKITAMSAVPVKDKA